MTTFTDVFGSDTVPPSEYSYAQYDVTENISLVWPSQYAGEDVLIADILELNVTVAALTAELPPADAVSTGRDVLIRNTGNQTINIADADGGLVTTIGAGIAKYVYVTNNATAAGTWSSFTFGTGTSAADASQLAGLGLQAASGLLRVYLAYSPKSSDYTLLMSDRARFLNVTSGVVTLNLPQASVAQEGYWFAVRNSGSGSVTINGFGTETINGSLMFTLNQNESTIVSTDGSAWYTIGQGKDATFTFSEFVVNAAAGNVSLTAADVAGRMIRVAGTAVGNITITLPSIDNIYFVNTESGLGGFTATFTTGAGATLSLGANLRTVIYSDGTNIRTAVSTTVTSAIALDDGSPVAPSLSFALDSNLGLFRVAADQMGVAANGVQIGYFDANGWNGNVVGDVTGDVSGAVITGSTFDLASNTLTGTTAQFNAALSDGDFATLTGTEVLTNKTIDLTDNTLIGTKAEFNAALSDDDFGYLATTNTWTAKQTIQGDLEFSGLSRRITANLSSATTTERLAFKTNVVNGFTVLGLIPDGTAVLSAVALHGSSDITNSSILNVVSDNITHRLDATRSGVGSFLPLAFHTGDTERVRITASGNMGVREDNPLVTLVVSNDSGENIELQGGFAPLNGGVLEYVNRVSPTTRPDMNYYIATSGAHKFFTSGIERLRVTAAGNIEHATFTKLGESSPVIKMKKLTGTTAAVEGGGTAVAHGLNSAKIIGIQAVINISASAGVTFGADSGSFAGSGYSFTIVYDSTTVTLGLHSTSSENILSKPFTILVTYEE